MKYNLLNNFGFELLGGALFEPCYGYATCNEGYKVGVLISNAVCYIGHIVS